jgi:hypothetical protein
VFAWVAQAFYAERPSQEAISDRISEIDDELSSLGYSFTHPGYNPFVYESRKETAEWEHFRLSYERALLSATHRIFREVPESPAFQLILTAAEAALTSIFSLMQAHRHQDSTEVNTAAGRVNLEPAATFASLLIKYLNDIYEFQVLIDNNTDMEFVVRAILEVTSTGMVGLDAVTEFFEDQLSQEIFETYGEDVIKKLVAASKRNSLPTLLLIEDPQDNSIQVFINERGLPLDHLSLSLARKMIVVGARAEINPFVENPFSDVLNFIFEQGPSPETLHIEDEFTDTLATMFDNMSDKNIVADWEKIVTEFQEIDSGVAVTGVLQEGSQESASSAETTYHHESLDGVLRKLCEYKHDGDPTQLDSYFNADPGQGNITVSQFFGGMATVIPRSPETEPDGKKIYQFDKVIRDIATEREEDLTFYSEVYGHAMAMICFYSDGNHLNGDATEWIQCFARVVKDFLSEQYEPHEQERGLYLCFVSSAFEILNSGFTGRADKRTQQDLQTLLQCSNKMANHLNVRGIERIVPAIIQYTIDETSAQNRSSWGALIIASLLNVSLQDDKSAARAILSLSEAVFRLARSGPPDETADVILRAIGAITSRYNQVTVVFPVTETSKDSDKSQISAPPKQLFLNSASQRFENNDFQAEELWQQWLEAVDDER